MNNNCENYKVVSVKKEVEDTSYFEEMEIDHKHFKSVEVKEVIEDEMKQENIENDLSNIFIKQECNLEIDWDCADDEQHIYNTNVTNWTSINMNSTNLYYKNKLFQCPECSVNAKYEANLNKHISIMHPKYKPLSYRGVQNKNKNMENICSLQTACPRCGKRYQYSLHLSRHINTCGKKKLFQCSTCIFTTKYEHCLIMHILQHLKKSNLCLDLNYGLY
ncbi:zinc finger protein 572-like isoform X2 [Phymastichus coffea]|uniref:zinc finger protein 572-like isoform X2 n=1 Tax=Phymastichus coffea TaxID=108790 RepID=UPI00273C6EC5|nr:zinc finger protein 572-like isoform X2 [Phymastichus coffea]